MAITQTLRNNDFLSLYRDNLNGFKEAGGGQFIAHCPYPDHDDRKRSFSGNYYDGQYHCFGCDASGNAVTFCKEFGIPNPHQYLTNTTDYPSYEESDEYADILNKEKEEDRDDLRQQYEEMVQKMKGFHNNLKNNMDKYPKQWDKKYIDELGIGLSGDKLVFGYLNKSEVEGYKIHNASTSLGLSGRWYPKVKIASYTKEKPLYICEGEKDVLTLISHNYQAITNSAGCRSIPKDTNGNYDLDLLKDYIDIYIVYDNDIYGHKGSKKLAKAILEKYPSKIINIIKWNRDLPEGYDVTDAFEKNEPIEFYDGLANAKSIKGKGVISMTGKDALNMKVKEQRWIVETIMPEKTQIVLGGAEGSNKSFLSMQLGMAIANNDDEFLGFDINLKNQKVLFFDTECGMDRLVRRYQLIAETKPDFYNNGANRFHFASKVGSLEDIFDVLEKEVEKVNPDVVMFDCLYNVLGGKDGSRNNVMQPLLTKLTDIRLGDDLTLWIIAHFNKGGHEDGLYIDRIAGAGVLKNWLEHCILMTYTNDESIRLMRFDKSRDEGTPKCYYALDWNYPILSMGGISEDWKSLLVTNEKLEKWNQILDRLPQEFTTIDFKNIVVNVRGNCEKTATNWLSEMVRRGAIKKIKHKTYAKKFKIRSKE